MVCAWTGSATLMKMATAAMNARYMTGYLLTANGMSTLRRRRVVSTTSTATTAVAVVISAWKSATATPRVSSGSACSAAFQGMGQPFTAACARPVSSRLPPVLSNLRVA